MSNIRLTYDEVVETKQVTRTSTVHGCNPGTKTCEFLTEILPPLDCAEGEKIILFLKDPSKLQPERNGILVGDIIHRRHKDKRYEYFIQYSDTDLADGVLPNSLTQCDILKACCYDCSAEYADATAGAAGDPFTVDADTGTSFEVAPNSVLGILGGQSIGTNATPTGDVVVSLQLSTDPDQVATIGTDGNILVPAGEINYTFGIAASDAAAIVTDGDFVSIQAEGGLETSLDSDGASHVITIRPVCGTVAQTGHGFVLPASGVIPVYYDTGAGEYVAAQADDEATTADGLIVGIPDVNTLEIALSQNLIVPGHGLTVGRWYVLNPSVAGGIVEASTVNESTSIFQRLLFVRSSACLAIYVQEAVLPCTTCPCNYITQNAHGFEVGEVVSLAGATWVSAVSGQLAYFVTAVIDANTFVISRDHCAEYEGLSGNVIYAVNPAIPGGLVDASTLDPEVVGAISVVGHTTSPGCLIGHTEMPLNFTTDPIPPDAEVVFFEGFQGTGAGCDYTNNPATFYLETQTGPGPFFSSVSGVDSTCSMQMTNPIGTSVGTEDHRWATILDAPNSCYCLEMDFLALWDSGAELAGGLLGSLRAVDGSGDNAGARIEIFLGDGQLNFGCYDSFDGGLEEFFSTDPAVIEANNWYRLRLCCDLGTPGIADGSVTVEIRDCGGDSVTPGTFVGSTVVYSNTFSGLLLRTTAAEYNAVRVGGNLSHVNPTTIQTQLMWDNITVETCP
jgi:hypothetical protein